MTRIKWNRSQDGYCESKCGRFEIQPLFIGRTTPQAFDLYYRPEPSAKREKIRRMLDTQREAKGAAQQYLSRKAGAA